MVFIKILFAFYSPVYKMEKNMTTDDDAKRRPGISISEEAHEKLKALQFATDFKGKKLKEIASAAVIKLYADLQGDIAKNVSEL